MKWRRRWHQRRRWQVLREQQALARQLADTAQAVLQWVPATFDDLARWGLQLRPGQGPGR